MALAGARLGVDYGSSNTVAMIATAGQAARPVLFDGSPLLASAIFAEQDGMLSAGRDAVHRARLDPGRFEPNPKRRVDENTVLLGDREFAVTDLVAATLHRVLGEASRVAGSQPGQVTLTCPAAWGATRRLVLLDAAERIGLSPVTLVDEPVAAAHYFATLAAVPVGSAVVVYDFGAGTFDASVVVRTADGFVVRASDGRTDLGGLDLDAALVGRIGQVVGVAKPDEWGRLMNPTTAEERRYRRQFWDDVRAAKERLSGHASADVLVPLLDVDTHVTRQEFEDLVGPMLSHTVKVTEGVLRWSKVESRQVAGVFLVGGSSRVPLAATLLHRALGKAPTVIASPELVVAEGALLASAPAPVAPPASVSPAPAPSALVPPASATSAWPTPVVTSLPTGPVHAPPVGFAVPTPPSVPTPPAATDQGRRTGRGRWVHLILWPAMIIFGVGLSYLGSLMATPHAGLFFFGLDDWLAYSAPLFVAGVLAAIPVRPPAKIYRSAGYATLLNLGILSILLPAIDNAGDLYFSDMQPIRALGIAVALVLAARCWLRLRGRTGARLSWALVTLAFVPLAALVNGPPHRSTTTSVVLVLAEAGLIAATVGLSALVRRRNRAG